MRWGDFRQSDNIEDRGAGGGFGGGGMRLGLGGIIIALIASVLFGINPLQLLGMLEGGDTGPAPAPTQGPPGHGPQPGPQPGPQSAPNRAPPGYGPQSAPSGAQSQAQPMSDERRLVGGVLGDTEDVWTAVFRTQNRTYTPPTMVLFSGITQSACGRATAAVGPFYCPGDRKLYLDTAFFRELAQRFGAPGDFAQAYVIAHEVGHHVQNLLGTMAKFDAQTSRMSDRDRNAMSVRLELQADCYAGVWGFYAAKRNLLDPGDADEGLRAAAAVGDDRLQKQMQGTVVPESFTHGSSQQRMTWFKRGLDSGDIRNCDTFSAR
jgi:hypothetical protein